jgi:Putative zinc-finger
MTCSELERLSVAGAPETELSAHRSVCASCAALGAELDTVTALVASLRSPAMAPKLREALLSIPRMTVSCEGADGLIAGALEGELSDADRARLDFHVSRCVACGESAGTLLGMRDLARPEPAPWLAGQIAAGRPRRERPRWRFAIRPPVAIALAYAAAVIVMLAGFNPADLARKAGVGRLEETARESVQVAGNSLADRLGAFEERTLRRLSVWKGRATGYGRAAISTAVALVMKTDSKPPSRPRSGEDKGWLQRNETVNIAWRLEAPTGRS